MRYFFLIIFVAELPFLIFGSLIFGSMGPVILIVGIFLSIYIYIAKDEKQREKGIMSKPLSPERRKKAFEKHVRQVKDKE